MKPLIFLMASAAIALAAPIAAQAQQSPDTTDLSVPTQLPRSAIPHHYAITVTPHASKLTFDGRVVIDFQVTKPTKELVLNAADLHFASASLRPAQGGSSLNGRISLNAEKQTATIALPREVAAGAYQLDIAYSGKINTQANGLFALDYKNAEGKDARSLFTQFEAADARRFVPSWDEPDYKATFDLTARVPAAEMAVSNMPAASSTPLAGGLKEVRFQTTPTMSSYLLFFATGDFDRITKQAAGREVGIVMSRGNGPKGQLALDAEADILPYYNDYFGTPFPLPKLDNVAGPGQSQFFGAMENWGAIFTFERILLNDPAITTEADRQAIFAVEAHEMAHQWFGDLVTMAWWNDLWLNEGFASWMANKANQHFHPDWNADVDHVAAREKAMTLDALQSTHPIVQDVRTVEQANQAFDDITYDKGESVISMLEGFATPDVWRAGIRSYIAQHAYQNSRTDDLWRAVEGAGANGLTQIAHDFTLQPGIPLIRVGAAQCTAGQTIVTLQQAQFGADGPRGTTRQPSSWHVPVRATAGGAPVQAITQGAETQIRVPGCGPVLINVGQTGYFRTLYRPEQAAALARVFRGLGPVDQYGLMQDAVALSNAGYQPMASALNFMAAVPAKGNAKIVERALNDWDNLYDDVGGDSETQRRIAQRVIGSYGPRLQQLGFIPREGEAPTDTVLRPTLITTLGKYQEPTVVGEAQRLFGAWQQDTNAIPGSLKETWLGVIASNANAQTWNAIHRKAQQARGAVERTTLYELLGGTRDDALARRALDLALTNEPGQTVSAGMITAVAAYHPRMAIDFVLAHLRQVNALVDISGRSRFMQRLAEGSADPTLIPVLERYASANLPASDRAPVTRAIERIRVQSASAERIKAETRQWLQSHPAGAAPVAIPAAAPTGSGNGERG